MNVIQFKPNNLLHRKFSSEVSKKMNLIIDQIKSNSLELPDFFNFILLCYLSKTSERPSLSQFNQILKEHQIENASNWSIKYAYCVMLIEYYKKKNIHEYHI